MNKVFKVIWNHATQSWVAVSELTSAKGKTKSKKLTALSVAVGSALVGTPALAAVYVNNQEVTTAGSGSRIFITTATHPAMSSLLDQNNPKYDYSIRIGDEGQPSTRGGDILIGYGHRNLSTGEAGDTIIGHRANVGGGNLDSFSTGVGYRVQSAGPSVSIGVGARSDIRSNSGWNGTRNGGVAIGAYALQGGNKDGGVAVGALSGGDYNYITSIGALSGVGGYQVDQVKNVGYHVNGGNDGATSIGYSAGARGQNSVAVGREATTANFKGKDAVSVGYSTHSIGESSVALGSYAVAGGFSESEITQLQTEKTRLEGVLTCITTAWEGARDELNAATSQTPVPSTAELKFRMGQLLSAREKAQQELNRINADLNRTSATPTQSTVTAMAIGYKAKANNQNATAIGRESQASAISAVALGTNARVNANLATSAVAIGQDANVLQNSSHAIAIGANASVVGDLNGSSGSIAIGHNTAAGNKNASWSKNASRELGYLAAQNATAVGSESVAGGTNSTAFGYKNVINAPNSGALGFNNIIGNHTKEKYNNNVASAEYNGTDSFVVGANNNVTANNTVVFGNNVIVNSQGINRTGAVVFGDNSTVPTEVKAVNSAKIGTTDGSKLVYSGFAGNLDGTDTDGNPSKAAADKQGRFVSVGNATSPRQVKFVAAGEISATSTDAINGSQLYAFSGVVNNLATSASTIIGGGATLNQNGTLENFSQPLNTTGLAGAAYTKPTTAANNIATAITNLNDYVNAGWKIAQGDDTAAKARISPNEQVNFKANGLATVSVEANGTGGADVTYSVQKGTFDTTTNGTVKANPTEGVVTNTDVATAVNNSGWNTTTTGGTNVTVNPGDQVNYVNGKGTNANVTTAKDANGKDVVSVSYNVNETTGTVNPNGTVKVSDNNAFLNASAVANLVNNAGFNVTTKAVDKFAEQTTKTARVKAGGNVTYIAGKNIAIEQDNQNFTFSTTKDVVFNNAQVNSTLTIGNGTATSPKVNIQSTTKGLDMGNAVLTNVSSGITPYAAGTTPVTTAKSGLADLANSTQTNVVTVADAAKLGWVVSTDKTTTDATTGTADGNVYAANVTTANEVKFVGKGYATVSGATDSNGVRTITVSVGNVGAGKINADGSVTETKAGLLTAEEGTKLINGAGWLTNVTNATTGLTETKVVTPGTQVNYVDGNGTTANVIKNTVGGKEVVSVSYDVKAGANTIAFNKDGDELVKVGDKYYKVADVVDGKPTNNAVAVETADIATADNRTPYENALNGLVNLTSSVQSNAMTVADAARMGWVVSTSANDYSANVTNTKEVNFVGLGAVDVSGSNVDEIRNINVSVDLPVDYTETTITENGQEVDVVKLSDGKWYKVSDLNDQGEPKDDAVAVDTKVTPISKKGAVLSDASSSLNNNPYKAKEYTYDDVNQTVTPKTYAELLAADPNFNKDEIKEGTNGVKLNNVGWAEAPDQAVNLDQLNQTVYKSGFYVKQNGVDTKGTNSAEDSATEKVTPEDVVNFVNGKNTVLKATTTRNAQTGQDTTNVTVDVDLPVVYTDAEGAKVVKVGDKYYYAEDVENGKLKNGVDADNDAVTNVVASMNNVASDDDTAGNNVVLRNVAEGTKTLAFDTEGNPLVEIDGKYYKLNEDGKADTTTVITPATSEQLKQLDDKYLANFTSAVTGLADLDHSDQSNALTVADAQKLGWVVSAGDYAANVTNANEVRFNGSNGISVTGETDKNTGVRNINVSIAKGKVDGNTTTGVATGDTNYVTGDQVAKAINESGWKTNVTNATTGLPETKVVTPGTQVDYVNGNGTTANVTLKDGKVAVSYNVNQTTGSVNPNGTATVTDGNAFLNASTVANLVNNSAFNVTTAKVDAFAENQEGKANAAVKAGGNITYTAGKNIAISQNGSNFTFSTTKDIEVDSVTANKRVQIGSGDTAVNLTTDLGALQVADKDGNATQITNVEAGTNVMAFNKEGDQLVQVGDKFYVVDPETNEVDFTKESTPATEEELDELAKAKPALKAYVAYSKAASGLADLDNSEQTNALTVADAQRLGWVVSASGNDYADSVTNANEVRFNGSNGISVTGETDEHGVRNINVSIAKGNVEGNTTTGVATGDTNYVTGDQVANAINNSGWKTTATKVVDEAGNEIVDANKATAVNPGDSVNYVDGNSTKANVVVTKAADGKETVNVSYDLVTEDHLTPVANDAKSVTKPTNIDAKGKDAATVNDVLNAGWNLQANDEAVDAVTHGNNVNFTSKDGSVKITAKSDGSTSSLDFAVNATSIVNQVAGTISYNKDGKATTNGDGKRIATVGDVANTINNTGWLTNVTDAKGNVTTKVVTPNTQVNYVNGDGTKANVVANSTTGGLDVTFNVKSANPETLTVDGNGVKVNTGSITEATDVAGDANRGKVTVAAGEGNKVATVQNVANAINSASWTVKVADTQEEITTSTANDEGSSVRAGNEITHVAGKNLKVKRDGRNVTYALANDVSVNTVTAQNSIKVGAGNAATTVTTSSAQDGVTEVKLADAAGKATRITNVAAGVKDTDAVNVSQLRNSNAQINQNIAHLNNKVNRMGKDLRAGIAGSNAAAGLPQVYIPGKSMVAAAAGTFKGQSAVAVGYSRASDNGKVILKLQGNANTRGDVGGSVGVGYQW